MTTTPETPRGAAFIEAARAERATHAGRGWPIEHDRERGPEHPLRLALDYLANGKPVEAGSLILAGLDLLAPGDLTDETINQPWNDPADLNSPVYNSPWEKAAAIMATIRGAQFDTLFDRPTDEAQDEVTMSIQRLDDLCTTMLAAARVAPITPSEARDEPTSEEYREGDETWRTAGQRMHAALLEIWHQATPYDTSHMTFGEDPQVVVDVVAAALASTSDHELIATINNALGGEYAGINTEARALRDALVEARLALLGRPSAARAVPAPSPDREKLIAELRGWANDLAPEAGYVVQGKVLQSVAKRASAALLTVPPVVNEAKLAEVFGEAGAIRLCGDLVAGSTARCCCTRASARMAGGRTMSRENGGMHETQLDAVRKDVIETIMFGYADAGISDEFGAEWGAGGEQEAREVVLEQFSDAAADAPIARYRVTVNVEEI